MGGATSTLSIAFDKPCCRGGEVITGRVLLRVLQDNKVHASELRLRFSAREHTSVIVETSNGKKRTMHEHKESKVLMANENVLCRFDGSVSSHSANTLPKGDYIFPFSMLLPHGVPSSFGFTASNGRAHCFLRYSFQACLSQAGVLFGTSEHNSPELDIRVEGTSHPVHPGPILLPPRSDKIYICCCVAAGTLHSGASLSSSTIHNGSNLYITMGLENHSTRRVKAVEITLHEDVHWRACGHGETLKFVRFNARMSPERFGSSVSPVTKIELDLLPEEVLRRIEASIQSASPGSVIQIPLLNLSNSHRSSLIQITHTLHVKICTPFGSSNCYLSQPLTVQSPPQQGHTDGFPLGGGLAGTYQVPLASAPIALPLDWNPKEYSTLPMAEPVWAAQLNKQEFGGGDDHGKVEASMPPWTSPTASVAPSAPYY